MLVNVHREVRSYTWRCTRRCAHVNINDCAERCAHVSNGTEDACPFLRGRCPNVSVGTQGCKDAREGVPNLCECTQGRASTLVRVPG